MNNQSVSREALLRSLDSLEEICVNRIENTRLIDDEQLPAFILSIQTALNEYAYRNSKPELALIAAKLPQKVNLLQIPFVVQVAYYILICVCLIGYFFGFGWFLIIFAPVIFLVVLAHLVVTLVFSRNRKAKLLQICNVADEAKITLDDSII